MPKLTPPQLSADRVILMIKSAIADDDRLRFDPFRVCPVWALAVRGYYRDTMGAPGKNDVGIWDDAVFLYDASTGEVVSYRWNVDPSRLGFNAAIGKGYAILQPGIWPFFRGSHKGKGAAWRQFDEETAAKRKLASYFADRRGKGHFAVWRGDFGKNAEWGYQAINCHWSDYPQSTSSWACQTAPRDDWDRFQRLSYALTIQSGQPFLPYVLTDGI